MPAIIIECENHPDRVIERILGPYPDLDTAYREAILLQESPDNIIRGYGSQRYNYQPRELSPPEEA